MQALLSLITPDQVERLASRSNFRYGKSMLEDAEIKIVRENRFNREATIKHRNGERRTVEIMSTTKGLRWKCTCSNKKDFFCAHCVAVGLYGQSPE